MESRARRSETCPLRLRLCKAADTPLLNPPPDPSRAGAGTSVGFHRRWPVAAPGRQPAPAAPLLCAAPDVATAEFAFDASVDIAAAVAATGRGGAPTGAPPPAPFAVAPPTDPAAAAYAPALSAAPSTRARTTPAASKRTST